MRGVCFLRVGLSLVETAVVRKFTMCTAVLSFFFSLSIVLGVVAIWELLVDLTVFQFLVYLMNSIPYLFFV